jgi:hypothetical protein
LIFLAFLRSRVHISVFRVHIEGIVAKAKHGRYDPARTSTWVKIKNRDYLQARDRHELFAGRQRVSLDEAEVRGAPARKPCW